MRSALSRQAGQRVTVEDDQTHVHYVVVPLDVYDRVWAVFNDDTFDIAETYPAQCQVAGAAGWDNPAMSVYDNYDAHLKSS